MKKLYCFGHTQILQWVVMRPVSPAAPYPVSFSMFVRCSRTDHTGIIEFIHLLVRAARALRNQETWLGGRGVCGGKLPQHTGIVGVITMGYMIRRIGLFVNAITSSTSALCSNNMATVCAWSLTAWLNFKPLIMQKLSTSGRISQYAAPNELGEICIHIFGIKFLISARSKERNEGTKKEQKKTNKQ